MVGVVAKLGCQSNWNVLRDDGLASFERGFDRATQYESIELKEL
jgi:hypothetical protein